MWRMLMKVKYIGQKIIWAKVHFYEEKDVPKPFLWPKIVHRPRESNFYEEKDVPKPFYCLANRMHSNQGDIKVQQSFQTV